MKFAVLVLTIALVGLSEGQYAPRGWRPDGPAFELPRREAKRPKKLDYLPPVEPRGLPSDAEPDVSVQGLPFRGNNDVQYPRTSYDRDASDQRFRQTQFEQRQTQTQTRQEDFSQSEQNYNTYPRQSTDSSQNANDATGSYPKELLLSPLTQIQFQQPQIKGGRSPILVRQENGFDGPIHLAALQSILTRTQPQQGQMPLPNQVILNQPRQNLEPVDYRIQPLLLQSQGPALNPDAETFAEQTPQDQSFSLFANPDQEYYNRNLAAYYQNQQQVLLQQRLLQQNQLVYQDQISSQDGEARSDIDQVVERQELDDDEEGPVTAVATATAFGDRTEPRNIYTEYGTPQKTYSTGGYDYSTTTEYQPTIAQATAVARSNKRRNSKLRSRRIKSNSYTLDSTGNLVPSAEQEIVAIH